MNKLSKFALGAFKAIKELPEKIWEIYEFAYSPKHRPDDEMNKQVKYINGR